MNSTKFLCVLVSVTTLPALAGCLDILGFKDPVRDDCAPNGCASGGGGSAGSTTTGGTGGSGTTGGTGGSGGMPVICTPAETQPCYSGAVGTKDVGLCKGGTQTCNADGTDWGSCDGEVTPASKEVCANQDDEDCDGSACGEALWVRAFDASLGGQAAATAFDAEGNLLVAGSFYGGLNIPGYALVSQSNLDSYVAKFDPSGSPLWAKSYGPNGLVTGMALTSDGGVIVSGLTYGAGTIDFGNGPLPVGKFVARLNDAGDIDWASPYGGASAACGGVAVDKNDQVIVVDCTLAGAPLDFGDGIVDPTSGNLVVAMLDGQNGAKLALRQFPGEGRSKSVVIDPAGSILIVGSFFNTIELEVEPWSSVVGGTDIFVLKLNPSLQTTWAQHYAGSINATADRVILDTLGNPVITGTFNGDLKLDQIDLNAGNQIARFISKLSFLGLPQWATSVKGVVTIFNGFNSDASGSVLLGGISNGPFEIQGESFGVNGETGAFLAKVNPDGTFGWARRFVPGVADAIASPPGTDDIVLLGSGAAQSDFGLGPLGGQEVQKIVVARYTP